MVEKLHRESIMEPWMSCLHESGIFSDWFSEISIIGPWPAYSYASHSEGFRETLREDEWFTMHGIQYDLRKCTDVFCIDETEIDRIENADCAWVSHKNFLYHEPHIFPFQSASSRISHRSNVPEIPTFGIGFFFVVRSYRFWSEEKIWLPLLRYHVHRCFSENGSSDLKVGQKTRFWSDEGKCMSRKNILQGSKKSREWICPSITRDNRCGGRQDGWIDGVIFRHVRSDRRPQIHRSLSREIISWKGRWCDRRESITEYIFPCRSMLSKICHITDSEDETSCIRGCTFENSIRDLTYRCIPSDLIGKWRCESAIWKKCCEERFSIPSFSRKSIMVCVYKRLEHTGSHRMSQINIPTCTCILLIVKCERLTWRISFHTISIDRVF